MKNYWILVAPLFLSCVAAQYPKFCVENVTKCNEAGLNFRCVSESRKHKTCVDDVVSGKADLALASADDMVENMNNLKIVLGEKITGLDKFVRYYGLAVVKKGTPFNFKQLKGKDSCHTGVLRTAGWKIPVGYLLHTKEMELKGDQFKSVSAFFGKSCAYDIEEDSDDTAVQEDLCSLCKGNNETKCTEDDPYAGYEGAFICMAEGNKDRVAFVKQTIAATVFKKYPGKYGTAVDYQLLCTDGEKKALNEYKTCNIEKRPAAAVVTSKYKGNDDIAGYKDTLKKLPIKKLKSGDYVSSDTESLKDFDGSVKDYVGQYAYYYLALYGEKPGEGEGQAIGGVRGRASSSLVVSVALQVVAIFALLFLL